MKAGDNILLDANWSFSGKTAKNFDKHIKKSVPLYEWSHDLGLKFSDFFFVGRQTNIYDLGCSTGTFLKALSDKMKSRKHNYYGVDEIKQMCQIAKKKK